MPGTGDVRPMWTVVNALCRKLGDDPGNPGYIFAEPSVGYRKAMGESQEQEA